MNRPREAPRRLHNLVLVEDKVEARQALVVALKRTAFHVFDVSHASAALSLIAEVKPAVVLTDIILPGNVDGFSLCRQLKADSSTAPYVVMMSGLDAPEAIERARLAGANAYLVKPFRLSRLFDLLARFDQPASPFIVERTM